MQRFAAVRLLHVDASDAPTLKAFLGRVQRVLQLVDEGRQLPQRGGDIDSSQSGVPRRALYCFNAPDRNTFYLPGLTLKPWNCKKTLTPYDWVLSTSDESPEYPCSLEYDTGRCESIQVAACINYYKALLELFASSDGLLMSQLPQLRLLAGTPLQNGNDHNSIRLEDQFVF